MAYLSLSPVYVGVFAKLDVAGMQALVGSRIYEDVPQPPTFPCVLIELQEREIRGFGTGGFPEVEIRVHVFSASVSLQEAQDIAAKAIELLRDQAVTVSGYTQAGKVFYDDTVPLADQIVNGVKCHELVARFRLYVEES